MLYKFGTDTVNSGFLVGVLAPLTAIANTVKLGNKERFDKEQIGIKMACSPICGFFRNTFFDDFHQIPWAKYNAYGVLWDTPEVFGSHWG